MSKLSTLIKLIKNDRRGILIALYGYIVKTGITDMICDELFLKITYYIYFGKRLNLKNPVTFNEKLQWLKLYYRRPEFSNYVDKYEVKKIISSILGDKYVIPTYGVWDNFDDINFSDLPNKFVLKCTHDSGSVILIKDKNLVDMESVKRRINNRLKKNLYYWGREWPYKNVKPRIIAEKYMEDSIDSKDLTDYKLMCFNGKVKCTFTCTGRYSKQGVNVTFYDTNWEKMPFERYYPAEFKSVTKPKSYEEMVRLAEKLADKLPFVRIDFYEIKDRPYFGEVTFYPGNGLEEFTPEVWDEILGSWLELPNKDGKLLFTNGG